MEKRLEGKAAIVVGAGQTPGMSIGNGRAVSLLFARAGARVLLVDNRMESAAETHAMIQKEGGQSLPFAADVTRAEDCRQLAEKCVQAYGKIDILVNNVGIGGGDFGVVELEEDLWDRVLKVNLKSMYLTCKHVLPYMERQGSGSIVNISSVASVCDHPSVIYKTSKAGVNALTHSIAVKYASKGIRVNAIMPGYMNTPMAIEAISKRRGMSREELIHQRDRLVPLKGGMGTGWDTAYAALFLASDEAKFITAVILPVDGGQCAKIG
jgi:NAD(P)-dependent dehydrogenase (short-subunit alcohol dehydrogenase family)